MNAKELISKALDVRRTPEWCPPKHSTVDEDVAFLRNYVRKLKDEQRHLGALCEQQACDEYLRLVAGDCVVAQDGGTGYQNLIDLQRHDRRFHHGHFDPETMSCGLRNELGITPARKGQSEHECERRRAWQDVAREDFIGSATQGNFERLLSQAMSPEYHILTRAQANELAETARGFLGDLATAEETEDGLRDSEGLRQMAEDLNNIAQAIKKEIDHANELRDRQVHGHPEGAQSTPQQQSVPPTESSPQQTAEPPEASQTSTQATAQVEVEGGVKKKKETWKERNARDCKVYHDPNKHLRFDCVFNREISAQKKVALDKIISANQYTHDLDLIEAEKHGYGNRYASDNDTLLFKSNLQDGSNCYKTAMATLLRVRGFCVKPRGTFDEGEDFKTHSHQGEFIYLQSALADRETGYEAVRSSSYDAVVNHLDEILDDNEKYPDGTALLCWNGFHGTIAFKQGHRFLHWDAWANNGYPKFFESGTDLTIGEKPGVIGDDPPIKGREKIDRRILRRGVELEPTLRENSDWKRMKDLYGKLQRGVPMTKEDTAWITSPLPDMEDNAITREVYYRSITDYKIAQHSLGLKNHKIATTFTFDEVVDAMDNDDDLPFNKLQGTMIIKPYEHLIPAMFDMVK